jgi:aspartyl protease family protein
MVCRLRCSHLQLYSLALCLGMPFPAYSATVYRCQVNHQMVFQALPCGSTGEEQRLNIEGLPLTGASLGNDNVADTSVAEKAEESGVSRSTPIVLHRGINPHFMVEGSINGVEVTFLIDTGATLVSLSKDMAQEARLINEAAGTASTAGGQVDVQETTIKHLKIRSLDLGEVKAVISPGLASQQVLLGMNVLRRFDITQKNDEMTLILKE